MFAYDSAIVAQFPTIRAGVIHATGLTNQPSPPALVESYRAAQADAAARLADTPIADLPAVAAWRRAFARFGAKPTQYRNAAEALLRRLGKHGDIPTVNTLVDIGNLVSIRYALPVAVFDQARIAGPTTVRFATGREHFAGLGETASVHPEPGEVVFVDQHGVVSARRWCWRQSAQSATGPDTTEVLVIVEGLHDTAGTDVAAALIDLAGLLAAQQPGSRITRVLLSPDHPRVGLPGGDPLPEGGPLPISGAGAPGRTASPA